MSGTTHHPYHIQAMLAAPSSCIIPHDKKTFWKAATDAAVFHTYQRYSSHTVKNTNKNK